MNRVNSHNGLADRTVSIGIIIIIIFVPVSTKPTGSNIMLQLMWSEWLLLVVKSAHEGDRITPLYRN